MPGLNSGQACEVTAARGSDRLDHVTVIGETSVGHAFLPDREDMVRNSPPLSSSPSAYSGAVGPDDEPPQSPNRAAFESLVRRLNHEIQVLHNEINHFWTDAECTSCLNALREKKSSLESSYSSLLSEEKVLRLRVHEMRNQVNDLDSEISVLEKEMVYRSEEVASAKLHRLQEQYNTQKFHNVRDEQNLVSQIDKIKRNLAKFKKYLPLTKQLSEIREVMNKERVKLRDIRTKLRTNRAKIMDCKHQRQSILRPFHEKRSCLRNLYTSKRGAVEKYQSQRERYNEWNRCRDNRLIVPSSCPLNGNGDEDEDELEPFFEQKRACIRLINYFTALMNRFEVTPMKPTPPLSELESGTTESSDSADEFPESFNSLRLKGEGSLPDTSSAKRLKPRFKKHALNTPLSHNVDVIHMLAAIDVEVPCTSASLHDTLQKVKEALEYYESQTNVVDWDTVEFAVDHNNAPSVSVSLVSFPESDMDSCSPCGSNLPSPSSTNINLHAEEMKSCNIVD